MVPLIKKFKIRTSTLVDFSFISYFLAGLIFYIFNYVSMDFFDSFIGVIIVLLANVCSIVILLAFIISVIFSFVFYHNKLLFLLGILTILEISAFIAIPGIFEWFNEMIVPYIIAMIIVPIIWFIKVRQDHRKNNLL